MNWLEKAFADRSNGLVFLRVEPELDPLRSNTRFIALQIALQAKLNFPNECERSLASGAEGVLQAAGEFGVFFA